jgi:hypothetical protein
MPTSGTVKSSNPYKEVKHGAAEIWWSQIWEGSWQISCECDAKKKEGDA